MTSSITQYSNVININFPPVGSNLSGVGEFHRNFNYIKESFARLSTEVNSLEKKLINLESNNNFGNNNIKNAKFTNTSYLAYDMGLVTSGIVDINYSQGNYQKCQVKNGYYTFNVTNWPKTNSQGKLRLEIKNYDEINESTCQIYFSGNTQYINYNTLTTVLTNFTLPASSPCFFDIWTIDSGFNLFVKPLGIAGAASTGTTTSGSTGPLPAITALYPPSAGSSGGYNITVDGTNFTASPQVKINGSQTPVIVSQSTTQIVFQSVASMAGMYQTVTITTANGSTSSYYYIYDDSSGI